MGQNGQKRKRGRNERERQGNAAQDRQIAGCEGPKALGRMTAVALDVSKSLKR